MNGKKYGRADVRDAHPGCVVPKKGLRTDMCLERTGRAGMLLPRTLADAERDDRNPEDVRPSPSHPLPSSLRKYFLQFTQNKVFLVL